jgi:copper chaperone CopZ
MRNLALIGFALTLAAPAFACPSADASASAYQNAAAEVAAATGTKVTLEIKGMTCGSCSEKVTAELKKINGVKAVAVDHATGMAQVAFDGSVTKADALVAAVKQAGYAAKLAKT